jgi:hypothetical protein
MSHCYWKKQPETHDEMRQAIKIFDAQELGCHRYAGVDPEIQARVGRENCDRPLPRVKSLGEAGFVPAFRDLQFLLPPESGWMRRIWNAIRRR